jgi:hypothetical protein
MVKKGTSQHLSGFFVAEALLPGRELCAKASFRPCAQPTPEPGRNVTERPLSAQFQGSVHRPVGIIEDFTADGDQIRLTLP